MPSIHGMGVKKGIYAGTANLIRTGYGASFRQNKSSSISNVSVVSNGKMWIRK